MIDVAGKAKIAVEKLIQGPQLFYGRGVPSNAEFQSGQQVINLTEDLLHVKFRIIVLCQADCGLQEWEARITFHQRGEVFKWRWYA